MRYTPALAVLLWMTNGFLDLIQIGPGVATAMAQTPPPVTSNELPTFQMGVLVGGKAWDMTAAWTDGNDGTQTAKILTPKGAAIIGVLLKNSSKLDFDFQYACTYRASSLGDDKTETQKSGTACPNVSPIQSLYLKGLNLNLTGNYKGKVSMACWIYDGSPPDAASAGKPCSVTAENQWISGVQISLQPVPPAPPQK
jgi:hypothetical protein